MECWTGMMMMAQQEAEKKGGDVNAIFARMKTEDLIKQQREQQQRQARATSHPQSQRQREQGRQR